MIYPNRLYDNLFSGKLVNESHNWIDKQPHVTQSYPNASDSLFIKINVTLVNKQKHMLKISVQELYNDITLPIPQVGLYGAINMFSKLCIGYSSLRK